MNIKTQAAIADVKFFGSSFGVLFWSEDYKLLAHAITSPKTGSYWGFKK